MGTGEGQPRILLVHAAAEVRAARALAGPVPLRFLSAEGAAAFMGWPGFRALLGEEWPHAVLDAADAPGHALDALRQGCPAVILSPQVPAHAALAAIARGLGARLLAARPPALDLARVRLDRPAGQAHLRRWLALHARADLP